MPTPDIVINDILKYLGVLALIISAIIILGSIGILAVKGIEVQQGRRALIAGVILAIGGVILIRPWGLSSTPDPQNATATAIQPTASTAQCFLPDGTEISPERLSAVIGGAPQAWTARGDNCVWGYWDPNNIVTFRHPGGNTLLTYWVGYESLRNADNCIVEVPPRSATADGETRTLRCPDAGAEFEADGVGFHPNP